MIVNGGPPQLVAAARCTVVRGAHRWQIIKATRYPAWPGPQFAGRAFFCRWGPDEKVEDESSLGHPARNSSCHVQTKLQDPSNLSTAPSYSGPFSLQPRIPPPYRNRSVGATFLFLVNPRQDLTQAGYWRRVYRKIWV